MYGTHVGSHTLEVTQGARKRKLLPETRPSQHYFHYATLADKTRCVSLITNFDKWLLVLVDSVRFHRLICHLSSQRYESKHFRN